MRPKPLIPTRTVMHVLRVGPVGPRRRLAVATDYSRACEGRRQFGRDRAAEPSGRATSAAHRLDPQGPDRRRRRRPAPRRRGRGTCRPGRRGRARPAGGRWRRGRRSRAPAGRRLPTWTTAARRRASAAAELGHARAPAAGSCTASPGARTIWSARGDRGERRRGRRRRRRGRARPGGSGPARFGTATWPSTGSPVDVGLQHHRIGGRRQHPADASSSRPASSSAAAKSPSVSVRPTISEVAEGVAVELAAAEAVLERLAPHACRRRPARPGTCAGRPARGRRGRGAAGPTSRRRRRRSPPR